MGGVVGGVLAQSLATLDGRTMHCDPRKSVRPCRPGGGCTRRLLEQSIGHWWPVISAARLGDGAGSGFFDTVPFMVSKRRTSRTFRACIGMGCACDSGKLKCSSALLVLTSASGLRVAPSVVIVQAGQQAICRRPFAGGSYRHLSTPPRLSVAKTHACHSSETRSCASKLGKLAWLLGGICKMRPLFSMMESAHN